MDVKKEEHCREAEIRDERSIYDRYLHSYDYSFLCNCRSDMGIHKELQMNYCDMRGLIWPFLFCVFVICILPVLLVDNAKYCKQSIVPCYPWTDLGENK